jgi:hypothetical protein
VLGQRKTNPIGINLPLKPVPRHDLDPAQTLFRLTFTAESDARQFCYVPNAVVVTLIRGKVSLIGYGTGKTRWRWVTMTNRASGTAMTLDTIVARLNIEHYRKKLSAETDETTRRTLLHLVAEEKAKLFALLGSAPAMED